MLFRFDPFDQLDRFGRPQSMLAMDATRTDDEVNVYFDLPGVMPEDLDITVEKNAVTIEASRRWFDADAKTVASERPQGTFKRELQLGEHLDSDALKAKLENGVLTLSVPIKEGTKPRSISVSTRDGEAKELSTSSASSG
ncbi:MAG: Hsp20 family protein [Acidimicrobiales bacterium]